MKDAEIAQRLKPSGLIFMGWPDPSVSMIPVSVARYAVSCRAEDGRTDAMLDFAEQRWRQDANRTWYETSFDAGLFGVDNTFLLAVALRPDQWPVRSAWATVKLAAVWDVVGENASDLLGGGNYHPEFVMLSLAGDVIVQGTAWQSGIGFLAVRNPRQSATLRERAEFSATWERNYPQDRLAAREWLDAGVD